MTISLALTPGEPAGVGPDLLIKLAQHKHKQQLIAFADPEMMLQRAHQLNLPLKLVAPNTLSTGSVAGELAIVAVSLAETAEPGLLNIANAPYVLSCLDQAIDACQSDFCQGMVTGPIHKSVISDSGVSFSGHTEYLARKTNTNNVVMMLATEELRVALVTTHLPLKDVSQAINQELVTSVINILHHDLETKFGIDNPRILVSGLNPHAGESGHLGHEEIDVIEPVLERLRRSGMHLTGPLPADTLFTPKYLKTADAVLAMYHDQGLPVLKYHGFGRAANITLGLPIIRTSVDHGTALDIAGTGRADSGSLRTAVNVATQMATHL
ncbi:4-hydroxythreonine-4-phosphate dehydrogenase PdxA [Gammaproteobacteria bacterium]|nr:4-hydroxythreonine-4-phosphate dehydrogenase PdxA [Gammaproteobacteria bacterium]|tara:strand:+ start:936 stop:1910 length:975 start_codon:yes stop_codon:yes gene_type:complete